MQLQKFRWSRVYESSEEELIDFLSARNIIAQRKAEDEFAESYGSFVNDTTLWCADGSFTIQVNETKFSMQPGDAIRIVANTAYNAVAGMSGCVFYESSSSTN